ncbi:hypothetical protein lbkm_2125 [Lachnospiraceae bacterium KM106-2]|nr:hypothetical protein lbkm_2125 [Lachnospiraceae bacterium KM106-2]
MDITVCIGSSCHLKGSREIVKQLEELIDEYDLKDQVELNGSFCMGQCVHGVCTKLDGELYSLSPTDTRQFFEEHVLRRLNG